MDSVKFLNCRIGISKKVFRPREETEFWVGKAAEEIGKRAERDGKTEFLDIFAGTGCIGISILKNIKNTHVDFSDIWPDAIKQIKINLKMSKIPQNRYKIFRSDLFEGLKNRRYNFIFANPPYVALGRIFEVQKEVLKKDPHSALFAGKDGVLYIEKFFQQVKKHLKPEGKIFMEFDPLQKEKIKRILEEEKLKFAFKKDQFGKYRWLEAEV